MGEEGRSAKVKVVDRRRFTPQGDLREPVEEQAPEVRPPIPPRSTADDVAGEPEGEVVLPSGPGILDVVDLLAQQAMALLAGKVEGRRDPEGARYFIDLIGVLREKTQGRLSHQEARVLDDVLFQLRTLFVDSSR